MGERHQAECDMEHLKDALERAKVGDVDGFAFLVERFQDMAVGYSYAILGDFHLAEDAAQEAFMEAYPNLHKVYGAEALPSWLRRVLFKHCDRIRRRKALSTTGLDEARSVAAADGNPEASAAASELEAEVRSAVSSLPPAMRLAVSLFYISDYSQREICEFLEIPVTTLKSRLHRARRQLRERMTDMVEESLQQNRPSRDKNFTAEVQRGLRDVYVDRTEVSLIDGNGGKLYYRGYSIDSLARHSTFEEVCYLMLYGTLPTRAQLDVFDAELKSHRSVPDETLGLLRETTRMQPIDALRTVVSAMGGLEPEGEDTSRQAAIRRGTRIAAAAPTILATHYRMRKGEKLVPPDGGLGHAANFLHMLSGRTPAPADSKALDRVLMLHAEHGANVSSLAARAVASTGSDLYSAITAAIAALKGPMHGGAGEQVIRMVLEIGPADRAPAFVQTVLDRGERVTGFGHPVYRTTDPRSAYLEPEAKALAARKGHPAWVSTLEAVVKAMEPQAKNGIAPNVDLWSAAIYRLLGIPEDMFSSVFAMGRLPGWVAHVVEQQAAGMVLRPRLLYVGPIGLAYTPMERRG